MKKIPILLTLLFCGLLSAQNFSTGTIPFSNTAGLAYSAEIATDSENVTLTLVGPSDRWLGIGFGTQAMSGGDCVIFNGTTLSDRTFIGNQQPSVDAVQTWTLISNNVEGSTRTVVGTRSLNSGQPNNYVFNNTAEPISLIWARGGSSNFTISYHGGANRGITMSQFELITAPATPAPTPTHDAADVISIYGDTYTSIATNFDPFWGQSGHMQVNPSFSVSGGNTVLAYPNFNYQGTEVTTVNASAMEFLHVDIWTNADPNATTIQVSPINNGTGAGETLVTINHVAGQWYSVDIPKSAFTGMTWNSVFQMKFAANGPGSAVPVDIYLDNIYFWKEAVPLGAVATLSDLQVDGETIANFLAIDNDYTFEVPQGSLEIPQISATATDSNANIVITQATAVPGDATVVVTSQNGEVINTYTVAFSFALLTQPSMVPPTPTHDAADVISIYGDTYTSIATNYDPFWGQSGHMQVNPTFSIDEGNVVLAYPNFNYQGTELTTTNASAMEFLHVDIWTNADPNATIVQVSPINNGTGAGETLVTINHVAEQWYSVDIPKSAFTNMTWDSVFQLKFAANGPGSAVPVTIYLDNIYFWKAPVVAGTVATLSDLQVDGTTIANFSSLDYDYSFGVPQGSVDVPQITITSTDSNAETVITQATSVPGDATVVVTSENGEVINTYTVAFSFELPTAPLTAAPMPMTPPMNVMSLFSNTYMNVPVSTWLTPWSAAALEDIQIMDNDTKVYSNLNFAGIEMTGPNSLDVTNATDFHLDFWTSNLTQLRIKLVDFGPNNTFGGSDDTEHEITIDNPTQYEWVSLSISMDDFVNLTGRQNISQLIISGMPAGSGTVYIDNIYFEMAPMVMVPTTQVEGLCGQTLPTVNSKVFFDNVIGATEYTYNLSSIISTKLTDWFLNFQS
uniref:DOMON domain-containing protein n=1 Tax=Flavobacterium sp. TaxID=239 RepID=UPI00404B2899